MADTIEDRLTRIEHKLDLIVEALEIANLLPIEDAEAHRQAKIARKEIIKLLGKGRTTDAARHYQERHGCTLAEAREAVEEIRRRAR